MRIRRQLQPWLLRESADGFTSRSDPPTLFPTRFFVAVRRDPQVLHPLADLDLSTLGRNVFVDTAEYLTNVSRGGQLGIIDVLRPFLDRVERSRKGVVRLFPLTRKDPSKSPRIITIDPRVAFGRPVIAGSGIPTAVLHERWKAGDSVAALSEDYDRTPDEIEEALRCEAA